MRALTRHWAAGLLIAVAAPLLIAFTRQDGIASFGDDSVSYLVLARWMDGSSGEILAPWLQRHSHFAPLFPAVLAAAGASQDLARAHFVVAVLAVVAIASIYRFVLAATSRRDAALAVAAGFMLTPAAWIGAKGILSEPLYLVVSLEALRWHVLRIEGARPRARDLLWFGVALGAAYLTRTAAIALVAAFAAHALARWWRERDARIGLAFAPAAAMALAWILVRPSGEMDAYAATTRDVAAAWLSNFTVLAAEAPGLVFGGWASSFTNVSSFMGDAPVPLGARVALAAFGLVALAGAALRARRNALDGWYVLATMAMLVAWTFDEANMRRLLYPVVPLLLFHGGVALAAACAAARQAKRAPLAIALAGAFLAAIAAAPLAGIASKSLDTAPLLEGHPRSAADVTEYYGIANIPYARAIATRHAAVLTGFEMLDRVTPPGARVMYVRPEYVAALGRRAAARLDYAWDDLRMARAVRESAAGFIAATSLSKADYVRARGDAMAAVRMAAPYTRRAFAIMDAAGAGEFVLLEVDREALERYLQGTR